MKKFWILPIAAMMSVACGGGADDAASDMKSAMEAAAAEMEAAMEAASAISSFSILATMRVKEAVDRSYEVSLAEGLLFERRTFHSSFSTEDQLEGMSAFLEKREANFKDK